MELKEILTDEPITPFHLLAKRTDGLSFRECFLEVWNNEELMKRFNNVFSINLGCYVSPIEEMIDQATGKQKHDFEIFLRFVWNTTFIRCPKLNTKNKNKS